LSTPNGQSRIDLAVLDKITTILFDKNLPITLLMIQIQDNLEHHLPFLDYAPQQIKSIGPKRPYHPMVINTCTAYFDSLF
jgi:hypothetical protein